MKDFTKYAMGIVTGISVAVALGAAGNGGQQDEPRSSTRAKRPAVERLGDQSCPVIEGAWGAPRLLEDSCGDTRLRLPYGGPARYEPLLSGFSPSEGLSIGVYGRSIVSLNQATGDFAFETPFYAIDESLVIPFFDPDHPFPGGNQYIGLEGVFFDVDGDGNRDFVARFNWQEEAPYFHYTPVLWFKNLAFPIPGEGSSEPRLPGDLNGDCEVSGADLGLLLNAYGNVCP